MLHPLRIDSRRHCPRNPYHPLAGQRLKATIPHPGRSRTPRFSFDCCPGQTGFCGWLGRTAVAYVVPRECNDGRHGAIDVNKREGEDERGHRESHDGLGGMNCIPFPTTIVAGPHRLPHPRLRIPTPRIPQRPRSLLYPRSNLRPY